jgi:hypothetical protein
VIRPERAAAKLGTTTREQRLIEEEPMSRIRRIALAVSVAAMTSLVLAGTALAGISLNGLD